ncbi:Hpt domain-containing protein [Lacrimispora defluvii]|uniref:Hpt domain-containing protein n=1 Tax=Lacrimispora defluvii TaxID=2719233 RepID=UPI002ED1B87B
MDNSYSNESMLDMYIYETAQNIEQLETFVLSSEKASCFTPDAVNEIFRVMHTIKGSSAMMMYDNIASLAHAIEDLFYIHTGAKAREHGLRVSFRSGSGRYGFHQAGAGKGQERG